MDEKKIEKKLEEISDKVEAKMKEMGDLVDKKFKEHFGADKPPRHKKKLEHSTKFWGVLLIVAGLLFLLDNIRWLNWDLPIIPIVMIIIGAYMIYGSRRD